MRTYGAIEELSRGLVKHLEGNVRKPYVFIAFEGLAGGLGTRLGWILCEKHMFLHRFEGLAGCLEERFGGGCAKTICFYSI